MWISRYAVTDRHTDIHTYKAGFIGPFRFSTGDQLVMLTRLLHLLISWGVIWGSVGQVYINNGG